MTNIVERERKRCVERRKRFYGQKTRVWTSFGGGQVVAMDGLSIYAMNWYVCMDNLCNGEVSTY